MNSKFKNGKLNPIKKEHIINLKLKIKEPTIIHKVSKMKYIFKTFFISVMMLAQIHFAYAQSAPTASLLPNAVQTFLDKNGNPLSSGTVTTYIPNTTTKKTTWQDSGQITPWANPLTLNAAGHPPGDIGIYGNGEYRQVVKDKNNNLIWDGPTSSNGTSSGGGGGSSIGDGNYIGTVLPWTGTIAPVGYVFAYGQELNRTTYAQYFSLITITENVTCTGGSPTITAITDTSQLNVGAIVEASCLPSNSTIVSKTSTSVTLNNNAIVNLTTSAVFFPYGNGNGLTTFNAPDYRGITLVGRCNMGGSNCSTIDTSSYGSNPNAINASGGNKTTTLVAGNLPPYTPAGTIAVSVNSANTRGAADGGTLSSSTGSPFAIPWASATGTPVSNITATAIFTGTPTSGASTPFSNIQPSKTINYIVKVLPNIVIDSISGSGFTGNGFVVLQNDATLNRAAISNAPYISINGPFLLNAETVPASITTSLNDYNPNSSICASTSELQLNSTSDVNITGFGGGIPGCILKVINNGSFNISFLTESSSSLALNRFAIGSNLVLASQNSTLFSYDGVNSRWRLIGGPPSSGGGGGGGSVTAVGTSGCVTGGTITTSGTITNDPACSPIPLSQYSAGGSGNDTTGVQAAFDACTTAGGCTLTCANGVTYTVDTINVGSNIRLAGRCLFQQRTFNNYIFNIASQSNVIIDGISLKATSPTVNTVALIYIDTTSNIRILNSYLVGSATVDSGLSAPTGGANAIETISASNVIISHNRFYRFNFEGVRASNSSDVIVDSNVFRSVAFPIRYIGTDTTVTSNNILDTSLLYTTTPTASQFAVGIGFESTDGHSFGTSDYATVSNNVIINFGWSQGILIHAGQNISITNTTCKNVGICISVNPFNNTDVIANLSIIGGVSDGTSATGIPSTSSDAGIVIQAGGSTPNIVNISVSGFTLSGHNRVVGDASAGCITVGYADYANISGNILRGCGANGIAIVSPIIGGVISNNGISNIVTAGGQNNGIRYLLAASSANVNAVGNSFYALTNGINYALTMNVSNLQTTASLCSSVTNCSIGP